MNDFKTRLSIPDEVTVAIVPANALLVSVQRIQDRPGAFLLSLEQSFIEELSDEELQAVVAHELGHVWIFTHHPYLQTEQLANRIALRLVSQESLTTTYGKVEARGRAKAAALASRLPDNTLVVVVNDPASSQEPD